MTRYRAIPVPASCDGMRLDRFLARRFADRSRAWWVDGIRRGLVRDGREVALRPSFRVRAGQELRVYLPGIAPTGEPPPLPPILHEDPRVVVFDKPPGLLAHPAGTDFVWALVSLAKARWPDRRVDLVHRLDRDTSGCLVVTKDEEANRFLKEAVAARGVHKEYEALVRGEIPWDRRHLRAPIGPAEGPIRIQMAARPDGQPAHTEVHVLRRSPRLTWVRCLLHTGRTHQIRVHLAHAGFPLLGDRLYGVPPEVFLHALEHGADAWVCARTGAPHHALHARMVRFPHPDGGVVEVASPPPDRFVRWWDAAQSHRGADP